MLVCHQGEKRRNHHHQRRDWGQHTLPMAAKHLGFQRDARGEGAQRRENGEELQQRRRDGEEAEEPEESNSTVIEPLQEGGDGQDGGECGEGVGTGSQCGGDHERIGAGEHDGEEGVPHTHHAVREEAHDVEGESEGE